VAEAFQCTPVEGVLSHQMKKHVIDANKVFATNRSRTIMRAPIMRALEDGQQPLRACVHQVIINKSTSEHQVPSLKANADLSVCLDE